MNVSKTTSYERFRKLFEKVQDPRDQALFALTYCAYARIGEVVRNEKRCKFNPPINKDNLEWTSTHLIISVLTEKTGKYRRVASSRALEDWLHEPIRNWVDQCDYELFPLSTRWAEYRFEKWFDTGNIHLLRHWACTHALQGKRTVQALKSYEVAQLGGWTDLSSFYANYSHFVVEDFIHKI